MKKFLGILFIVLAGIMTFFGIVALVPARSCTTARADSFDPVAGSAYLYTVDLPSPDHAPVYDIGTNAYVDMPILNSPLSLVLYGDLDDNLSWVSFDIYVDGTLWSPGEYSNGTFEATSPYDGSTVNFGFGGVSVPLALSDYDAPVALNAYFTQDTSSTVTLEYYFELPDSSEVLFLTITCPLSLYPVAEYYFVHVPLLTPYNFNSVYVSGFTSGYNVGVDQVIGNVTPWNLLVQQVNRLLDIPILGYTVRFSTIISIGIGMLFLGIGLKFFLGG